MLLVSAITALLLPGCAEKTPPDVDDARNVSATDTNPDLEIDFSKEGYPSFVKEIQGLSIWEDWGGRFTDANLAPTARIQFHDPLPSKFTLVITTGASVPNLNMPVKVRIGAVEKEFVVQEEWKAQTYRLPIELSSSADVIEIVPPNPRTPSSIDPSSPDGRKLGLSLRSIRIEKGV